VCGFTVFDFGVGWLIFGTGLRVSLLKIILKKRRLFVVANTKQDRTRTLNDSIGFRKLGP
jgi:hypothetical protein